MPDKKEQKSFKERLLAVQTELKAPKGQMNKFGGYKYRSCEDIIEALKPHLKENRLVLRMEDAIIEIAGRVYVRAAVRVTDVLSEEYAESKAYAREAAQKKGMDEAQVTGAASSYARKYALCGLFGIDDGNDPDSMNRHEGRQNNRPSQPARKWNGGPTDKQLGLLRKFCGEGGMEAEETDKFIAGIKGKTATEVSKTIEAMKKRLEEKKAGEDEFIPTEEDVDAAGL